MKNLLVVFLLLFSLRSFTQDIDIPDPFFLEDLINNGVDTSGDGIIQITEAEATVSLQIIYAENTEGLEHFINLTSLEFEGGSLIMEMDISNLGLLERLKVSHFIESLDLSGNPLLRTLICEFANFPTLDLSNNVLLDSLDISHGGTLENLDLTNNTSISYINAAHAFLSVLTAPNCPELKFLNLEFNQLEQLEVNGCPKLEYLNLEHNSLLETLDLSANPALKELLLTGNPELRFINLSNGSVLENLVFDFHASKEGLFICVDPDEFNWMQDLVNTEAPEPEMISVSTVCNHSQGGNYHTISGRIGFDTDGICDYQGDIYPNVQFKVESDQGFSFTSSTGQAGNYDIYLPSDDGTEYTITPQLYNSPIFTIDPPQIQFTLDSSTPDLTQDFCISPRNVLVPDVKISIIPIDIARPGFEVAYKVIIENQGNTSSSGSMVVDYPEEFSTYVSSTGTWTDNDTHLVGTYADLLPFQREEFEIIFRLNSPMDEPALNDGDILKFQVVVFPDQVDNHAPSLGFELCQEVVNSYDPNDKTCLNGPYIYIDTLENNPLVYKIRFENTGTADAVNITIQDEIDPLKYDLSSIRLLDASHEVQMQTRSNTVDFVFEDIYLPWQDELNDGYVVFEIEAIDNIAVNDSIVNAADIYFDFNFPIITEDAISVVVEDADNDGFHNFEDCDDTNPEINPDATEIDGNGIDDDCDGVSSLQELISADLKLFPNPTEDLISITSESNIENIQILSTTGILLMSTSVTNSLEAKIDLSTFQEGMYILKIKLASSQKEIVRKIIKL